MGTPTMKQKNTERTATWSITAPPDKTLLNISCPNLFVPIGKFQLGGDNSGLLITGGVAVGSLGVIQGLIKVIMTIDETIIPPISVIQPPEPLLVRDAKPGKNRSSRDRLNFNLLTLITPIILSSGQGMHRKCLQLS